jgi:hypothetical protein
VMRGHGRKVATGYNMLCAMRRGDLSPFELQVLCANDHARKTRSPEEQGLYDDAPSRERMPARSVIVENRRQEARDN